MFLKNYEKKKKHSQESKKKRYFEKENRGNEIKFVYAANLSAIETLTRKIHKKRKRLLLHESYVVLFF